MFLSLLVKTVPKLIKIKVRKQIYLLQNQVIFSKILMNLIEKVEDQLIILILKIQSKIKKLRPILLN
jgi:hypothetical protein